MPQAADYLGEAHFSLVVVPARVAYLIAPRSKAGMLRAIQTASVRWAGATEPIIVVPPRRSADEWDKTVIRTADVDALVNVDASSDAAAKLAAELQLPLVSIERIHDAEPCRWTSHPVDIGPVRRFSSATLPSSDALWEAVAVGALQPAYVGDFQAAQIGLYEPAADAYIGINQANRSTILDLGLSQFAETQREGLPFSSAIIWVVKLNDVKQCRHFWNLRSMRTFFDPEPMLILPSSGVEHWVDFDKSIAALLSRRLSSEPPDVLVVAHGVREEAVNRLMSLLGLQRHNGPVTTVDPRGQIDGVRRAPPFSYAIVDDVSAPFFVRRRYGVRTEGRGSLFRKSSRVPFPIPVRLHRRGFALLRLDGEPLKVYPPRPAVAKMLNPEAIWRHEMLEVGWTLLPGRDIEYYFNLPKLADVLRKLMDDQQVDFKLSDKGALAAALDSQVHPAELVAPGVMDVIRDLTTRRSKYVEQLAKDALREGEADQRIAELIAAAGGRERRFRLVSQIRSAVPGLNPFVLERLTATGWVERGLAVDCDVCGLKSFVPLTEATTSGLCPACGETAGYQPAVEGPAIAYRLNAVIDRASDQGVLPQAIAAARLRDEDSDAFVLPGVQLTTSSGVSSEADLLGIFNRQLLVGEVKSNPNEFTTDELAKAMERTELIGADLLVLASLIGGTDGIFEDVRQEAKRRGVGVKVMNGLTDAPGAEPDT